MLSCALDHERSIVCTKPNHTDMQADKRVRVGVDVGVDKGRPRYAQPWTLVLPWMDVWALGRLSRCNRWFHQQTWPTIRHELLFRCLGIPRNVVDKGAHVQLLLWQRTAGSLLDKMSEDQRYKDEQMSLARQLILRSSAAGYEALADACIRRHTDAIDKLCEEFATWTKRAERTTTLVANVGRPTRDHAGDCLGQSASCESCCVAACASRDLVACPVYNAHARVMGGSSAPSCAKAGSGVVPLTPLWFVGQ